MQFLANENIPSKSISILRNAGYDVIAIGEESPGISDRDILNRAQIEHRIILTFDRDYGELIYKRRLMIPAGVVYFRFIPISPEETGSYFVDQLKTPELKWEGKFTIIERGRIRQRPLPQRLTNNLAS